MANVVMINPASILQDKDIRDLRSKIKTLEDDINELENGSSSDEDDAGNSGKVQKSQRLERHKLQLIVYKLDLQIEDAKSEEGSELRIPELNEKRAHAQRDLEAHIGKCESSNDDD